MNPSYMERLFPYIFWNNPNILNDLQNTKEKNYMDFTKKYKECIINP